MIRPPGIDNGAFVVLLETVRYTYYIYYVYYIYYFVFAGRLNSIGSQILHELDHRKPVLYVIPVEHILGKLPLVPVGDIAFSIKLNVCMQDVVRQLVGNNVVP
jgi:hypothetical protein